MCYDKIYGEYYTIYYDRYYTKDFVVNFITSKVPDDFRPRTIEEVSEYFGINFSKVSQATIAFENGKAIEFRKENHDGEPVKEILGRKLYRDWSLYRSIYVDPELCIKYFEDEHKIVVDDVEIPDNFPVDDPEEFLKNPKKYIAPHIREDNIRKIKATKTRTLIVEVSSSTKRFRTSIKKTEKYFIYRNVPFAEGIYDVKVPTSERIFIEDYLFAKDLPKTVKLKDRIHFTDNIDHDVERIEYLPTLKFYRIQLDNYVIKWDITEDEIYLRYKEGSEIIAIIKAHDPQLVIKELLESDDIPGTAKFLTGLM